MLESITVDFARWVYRYFHLSITLEDGRVTGAVEEFEEED